MSVSKSMAWMMLAVLAAASGCDLPKRPVIEAPESSEMVRVEEVITIEPPVSDWQGPWQASFLYFRAGKAVGYNRISATYGDDRSPESLIALPPTAKLEMNRIDQREASIWYDVEDVIHFVRGKAVFVQEMEQVLREATSGEVRAFWNRLLVGPAESQATGVVEGSQLVVDSLQGGKRGNRVIAWDADSGGTLAVMQSLRHEPLRAGETRRLKQLLPIKNELATLTLTAVSETSIPWIDGSTRLLLEVTQSARIAGELVSESVIWIDEEGEIQRTFTPSLDLVSYRVD
ncbi:MAG: hypothetical protein AAF989_09890, partial [Planctomycetota bacterium]